jgi:hypothetical protein
MEAQLIIAKGSMLFSAFIFYFLLAVPFSFADKWSWADYWHNLSALEKSIFLAGFSSGRAETYNQITGHLWDDCRRKAHESYLINSKLFTEYKNDRIIEGFDAFYSINSNRNIPIEIAFLFVTMRLSGASDDSYNKSLSEIQQQFPWWVNSSR